MLMTGCPRPARNRPKGPACTGRGRPSSTPIFRRRSRTAGLGAGRLAGGNRDMVERQPVAPRPPPRGRDGWRPLRRNRPRIPRRARSIEVVEAVVGLRTRGRATRGRCGGRGDPGGHPERAGEFPGMPAASAAGSPAAGPTRSAGRRRPPPGPGAGRRAGCCRPARRSSRRPGRPGPGWSGPCRRATRVRGPAMGQTELTLPRYCWIGRTPIGFSLRARMPSMAARAPVIVVIRQTLWA